MSKSVVSSLWQQKSFPQSVTGGKVKNRNERSRGSFFLLGYFFCLFVFLLLSCGKVASSAQRCSCALCAHPILNEQARGMMENSQAKNKGKDLCLRRNKQSAGFPVSLAGFGG